VTTEQLGQLLRVAADWLVGKVAVASYVLVPAAAAALLIFFKPIPM
jgi:hypothetical protein